MTTGLSLDTLGNPQVAPNLSARVYLLLSGNEPLLLGEGKFARVYLGALREPTREAPLQIGELVALKFLKQDPNSPAVTRNAVYRFCQEVMATAKAQAQGVAGVVKMHGYGRFEHLPAEAVDRKAMEQAFGYEFAKDNSSSPPHTIFGTRDERSLEALFAENRTSLSASKLHLSQLTGDFYVLGLCLMNLEEILLAKGDPYTASAGRALQSIGLTSSPILVQRQDDAEALAKNDLNLEPSGTGFDDLKKMADWLEQRRSRREPEGRRLISVVSYQLWHECVALVDVLHSIGREVQPRLAPADESARTPAAGPGWAHRDIKPANLLVTADRNMSLVLSDLGFLATVGEVLSGQWTLVGSIDEGGVLPAGSRGFRSPEQIESGEEISFAPATMGQSTIELVNYLDSSIAPGDWLRISGMFADRTSATRITSVETVDERTQKYSLYSAFGDDGASVAKGRIVKDVAIHSDVFSLGCLAYFLSSEGRNPERFMRQFLDDLMLDAMGTSLPAWTLESPLWLSVALCMDTPAAVMADLRSLVDASSPQERNALDGGSSSFVDHFQVMTSSLRWYSKWSGEASKVASFRRSLRRNYVLSDLLHGRVSKSPISLPLLVLAVACCLRGRKGSVVTAGDVPIGVLREEGFVYSRDEADFARRITNLALRFQQAPSVGASWGALARLALGPTARDQFLRARFAARRKPIEGQPP